MCIAGLCVPAFAQPEVIIREDDVPFVIGQWARFDQNTAMFEWDPFDSTRTWWDLTVYPGGSVARIHLLNPSQGIPPAPDTFPAAEIVELDTLGNDDVVWSYLENNNVFFLLQGIDFETGGFRFIGNYQLDYRAYSYPIYYGGGWNTAFTWQYEILPSIWYIANETHHKRVCAKGKVKVPMSGQKFWPCLVIRDYMTYSDNMGTNDTRWIYEWVVPGRFGGCNGVAAAQSRNGASSNFMIVENFFNLNQLYVPGWDLNIPDFANTTIWPDTSYTGPFPVSSTITDPGGIGADSLFYNINGGAFAGVGHDSVIGDVYYFTIPAVAQACSVGYFLWAEDSFCVANSVDIWNTDPICAPESTYYRFYVSTPGVEELTVKGGLAMQIYPNPFRENLNIRFDKVNGDEDIELRILDVSGRVVKEFPRIRSGGLKSMAISWDGTDDRNLRLPSGIYFLKADRPQGSLVKTVLHIE